MLPKHKSTNSLFINFVKSRHQSKQTSIPKPKADRNECHDIKLYISCRRWIAVSRRLAFLSVDPVGYGQGGGIQTGNDTETGQRDIDDFLSVRLCAGSKV